MPALKHGLGQRDQRRCGLSARTRTSQHDRAAELGDGLAGQAGVVMDSGELVRGEADVELVLARIVSARSRHAKRKQLEPGEQITVFAVPKFLLAKTQLAPPCFSV